MVAGAFEGGWIAKIAWLGVAVSPASYRARRRFAECNSCGSLYGEQPEVWGVCATAEQASGMESWDASGQPIMQLRVVLCHMSPLIWRRLLVSRETNLAQLPHVLQVGVAKTRASIASISAAASTESRQHAA